MSDRKKTVTVARFTVEVEVDAEAFAALSRSAKLRVVEEAEAVVDQELGAIGGAGSAEHAIEHAGSLAEGSVLISVDSDELDLVTGILRAN